MATKQGTLRIDFSKEEEGGGGGNNFHYPPGDYHVKVLGAKSVRSSEKDTPGLEVSFQVIEGKKKGKKFKDTLWLTPKSLKRVRLLLEAVGVKVPKSAVNLPLGKLKGKTLWVELDDEEREGYDTRSRVTFEGFMSEDDYEGGDDADDDEDDEDLDEDDDDEEDDEDEDDEDDEDDDDDEEEDEEPEPVKKRRSRSAKPAAKKGKKKAASDDDDEIEDLDLDEL
jgi:hypothetical protein